MKQACCEVCGSIDLVKDGGVFVCQDCGCKYSVAEIREQLSCDVLPDDPNFSTREDDPIDEICLAFESGDFARAVGLCDEALDEDPDIFMARIYRAFSEAWLSFPDTNLYMTLSELKRAISSMHAKFGDSMEFCLIGQQTLSLYSSFGQAYSEVSRRRVESKKAEFEHAKIYGDYSVFQPLMQEQIRANNAHLTVLRCILDGYTLLFEKLMDEVENPWGVTKAFYGWICDWFMAAGERDHSVAVRAREIMELIDEIDSSQYWAAHPEEKIELLEQLASIDCEIDEKREEAARLESELTDYPSFEPTASALDSRKKNLLSKVEALRYNRKGLGLFAKKEKAEIDQQISKIETEISELEVDIAAEISRQRAEHGREKGALQDRIAGIHEAIRELENRKVSIKRR